MLKRCFNTRFSILGLLILLAVLMIAVVLAKAGLPGSIPSSFPDKQSVRFECRLMAGGGVEVRIGGDSYVVETAFSYPGDVIGHIKFLQDGENVVSALRRSRKEGNERSKARIECEYYSVERQVRVVDGRIEITELLKNKTDAPVGIIIEHQVNGSTKFQKSIFSGYPDKSYSQVSASNPTVYLEMNESSLGVVAEDNIFRLQFSARKAAPKAACFGLKNFALAGNGKYVMRWSIYPLGKGSDYFSMVNRVREVWKTNFTIKGPFDFLDVICKQELFTNKEKLKSYFQEKDVRIAALMPWLDYDNYNSRTKRSMTRKEYRETMRAARDAIKEVDPSISVIGCIPSNYVLVDEKTRKAFLSVLSEDHREQTMHVTSKAEKEVLDRSLAGWRNSIVRMEDGNYHFELYYPMKDQVIKEPLDNAPAMIAVATYARVGNAQYDCWMEQAHFMIEEVGLDGIYIDQFSLAFADFLRYSYGSWDGTTVSLDPVTGRIREKYTDGALVGIEARKRLAKYVLSKGTIMVANTYAAVEDLQSIPIYRFGEGYSAINPLKLKAGQEPPFFGWYLRGSLGSPISLGYMPWCLGQEGMDRYAEVIMRTIVIFLRHGQLFYCFNTEIPKEGLGSGDYGPINHLFPITPVSVGGGFVEGKERIISTVSRVFLWPKKKKPSILSFDLKGQSQTPNFDLRRTHSGWEVDLKLQDWKEIAIIE